MERRYVSAVVFNGVAAAVAALVAAFTLFGRDWAFFARMPLVPIYVAVITGLVSVPLAAGLIGTLHRAGVDHWRWPVQASVYGLLWAMVTVLAIAVAWLVYRSEASGWPLGVLGQIVLQTLWMSWGLPLVLGAALGVATAYRLHRYSGTDDVAPRAAA